MTVPPNPDTPTLRTRFIWNKGAEGEGGVRLYFSFTGGRPNGADCTALASAMASAWGTHIAPVLGANCTLDEVDVLDITDPTGLSGQAAPSIAGANPAPYNPWQVAMDVEFNIALRYRGGKPRIYLPPPTQASNLDQVTWSPSTVTSFNSAVSAFAAQIAALTQGSTNLSAHVMLSYYHGFTNITNSSGRTRAVPTYRPVALHHNVTGYSAKATMGSQKRRRTSTTP